MMTSNKANIYKYPVVIRDRTIPKKINGREAIFLDTNIWIDLAEAESVLAKRVKKLLIKLVDEGRVFCPLSEAVIWELYKQEYDSMLRVAKLMEKLSLNISFAIKEEIFALEIESFVLTCITEARMSVPNKTAIYVPIVSYLSSTGTLRFPNGWDEASMQKFAKLFVDGVSALTLTKFLKMRRGTFSFIRKERSPGYSETWRKRWQLTQGDKEKMRRYEEETIASKIMLPTMNRFRAKLPLMQQLQFIDVLKSLPRDKYGGCLAFMLAHMPALKNEIEILTISGFDNNRKGTMNDFFDIEMLAVPLAYADALVSSDKWLKHLLRIGGAKIAAKIGYKFIPGLGELEIFLMKESSERSPTPAEN